MKNDKCCCYCEREFTKESIYNIIIRTEEHVVPLYLGGRRKGKNVLYACPRCNKWRGRASFSRFIEILESKNQNRKIDFALIIKNIGRVRDYMLEHNVELVRDVVEDPKGLIESLI